MKGILTSITYDTDDDGTNVYVFVRGEDKNRYQFKFKGNPYFYISRFDVLRLGELSASRANMIKSIVDVTNEMPMWARFIGDDKVHLSKILLHKPNHCPLIRDNLHDIGVKTYEADVPYVNRWLIDSGIKLAVEIDEHSIKPLHDDSFYVRPRYWIIDIEAMVDTEEKIDVQAPDPIICIGIYDSYDKKYYILHLGDGPTIKEKNASYIPYVTENLMLKAFYEMLHEKDPCILMGFNLAGYDIPKIVNRSYQQGVNPKLLSPIGNLSYRKASGHYKIQGREIVDVYHLSRFIYGKELREHNLDYVNKILGGGVGKFDMHEGFNTIWRTDAMRLLRYNKRDLDCVLEIELEQDLVSYLDQIRRLTGITYGDILYKTTIYDMYMMRILKEEAIEKNIRHKILMTNPRLGGDKYPGAVVMDPNPGVFYNVLIIDFSSLYPNVFITFNIDYNTVSGSWTPKRLAVADVEIYDEMATPSKDKIRDEVMRKNHKGRYYYVSFREESMLNKILMTLLKRRQKTKEKIKNAKTKSERDVYDKQDAAFKVVVNSAYGVMGMPKFRRYKPDVGAAVTAGARHIIQYTILKAQEMGYNVVYGDTDSVFIELGKDFEGDLVETGREIAKSITASLREDMPYIFSRVGGDPASIDSANITLDIETVCESIAIWAKKNYLKKILWTKGRYLTDYDWRGRGNVRSNVSKLVQDLEVTLGRSIVDDEPWEKRKEYLDRLKERLLKREVTLYDVGIPQQLTKNMEEYKTNTIHVRAATYSNENFGTRYGKGDKPMYAYIISPSGKPVTDVIAYTRDTVIPSGFQVDLEKFVVKYVHPTIKRYLTIMGEEYKIPLGPLNHGTRGTLGFYFNAKD